MDSDVNALDDLLTSLEQINAESLANDPPIADEPGKRDTALLERKGLGVKVVSGEPNAFGVRLRKVNATELSPSAAAHASIAGDAPLATQVATYEGKSSSTAPLRKVSPQRNEPLHRTQSPAPGPGPMRPPPPPTIRSAEEDVDLYLNNLSEGIRNASPNPRGTRKFVDNSEELGSEMATNVEDLSFGLPPPPRPFTIPPIPPSELKRQLAELDDAPPLPNSRPVTYAVAGTPSAVPYVAAGTPSAFPPGVERAPVSQVPPRPPWSALHTDLTYTPTAGTPGVYGITFKGVWQPVGGSARHVAIKRFKYHNLSREFIACFEEEVPRMVALNHPNVLPLLGVCLQDFNFALFEWHDEGTLATFLERNPRPNPEIALRIAKEIALGVEELHECGIIHGSLRPSNVMLDRQQHVRVADYGFEYVKAQVRQTGQTIGCEYNAPEQLENGPAPGSADAVDVYSIAVIINQLFAGAPPHAGLLPRVIVAGVAQSSLRPQLAKNMSSALRRTVQAAWAQQPRSRPTFATIVAILQSPPSKLLA